MGNVRGFAEQCEHPVEEGTGALSEEEVGSRVHVSICLFTDLPVTMGQCTLL